MRRRSASCAARPRRSAAGPATTVTVPLLGRGSRRRSTSTSSRPAAAWRRSRPALRLGVDDGARLRVGQRAPSPCRAACPSPSVTLTCTSLARGGLAVSSTSIGVSPLAPHRRVDLRRLVVVARDLERQRPRREAVADEAAVVGGELRRGAARGVADGGAADRLLGRRVAHEAAQLALDGAARISRVIVLVTTLVRPRPAPGS